MLIASQSNQEWRNRTDKSIFPLHQDFLEEKKNYGGAGKWPFEEGRMGRKAEN